MLFTLYMDNLSLKLNCSGIVGYIGTSFINHLCYVDDLCLISLSSSGMQHLLNICKEYAFTHKLLCNGSKSFALCFKKNTLKVSSPSLYLDQMKIPTVDQCRYLGITISTNNSDVDLKRQMRKLYANVNLLLREFSKIPRGSVGNGVITVMKKSQCHLTVRAVDCWCNCTAHCSVYSKLWAWWNSLLHI